MITAPRSFLSVLIPSIHGRCSGTSMQGISCSSVSVSAAYCCSSSGRQRGRVLEDSLVDVIAVTSGISVMDVAGGAGKPRAAVETDPQCQRNGLPRQPLQQ